MRIATATPPPFLRRLTQVRARLPQVGVGVEEHKKKLVENGPRRGVGSAFPMSPEHVVLTKSAAATQLVAAALAELAEPGDLLLLTGDLGAGKTTFCQGFGLALGVTTPITSPTFTLHHRYEGRLVLHHLDVYRLDQIGETIELGLSELLDSGGITVIEWGDNIRPVLPPDYLELALELGQLDDDRRLRLRYVGPSWAQRFVGLDQYLSRAGGTPL